MVQAIKTETRRNKEMKQYQIRYYDVVLHTLSFASRKDAVIFCGANYGGQVGINVKEI